MLPPRPAVESGNQVLVALAPLKLELVILTRESLPCDKRLVQNGFAPAHRKDARSLERVALLRTVGHEQREAHIRHLHQLAELVLLDELV